MDLFGTCKLLLVLVVTAYIFSENAEASWSWGSSQSGSGSGGGLSSRSSDSNSSGSTWGWAWTSNGTDTNWSWGNSSGLNHSSGSGSTHNSRNSSSNHNYTAPSNHSSGTDTTSNNYTVPSNHSGSIDYTSDNYTAPITSEREIVVTVWKSGFDYQQWVCKNGPFYIEDVLVFKNNDQPNQTQPKKQNSNNNVYLLPDRRSYERCDVTRGKKLVARGHLSSEGFKLLLNKTQPYYLASGDHKSCSHNNSKFSLYPFPRPPSY